MRPKRIDIDPVDVDADGIATSQSVASATTLTLDGALASSGTVALDYARQVVVTSAGNDSGITFTVVGTDADSKSLTEVVTGANAAAVETTKYFKTVASITTSGATASTVTAGTADEIVTATIPLDYVSDNAATIAVDITGTIDLTVEQTFDEIQNTVNEVQSAQWFATGIAGATADEVASTNVAATAVRLKVNSYSNGAEVQFHVNQPGGQ